MKNSLKIISGIVLMIVSACSESKSCIQTPIYENEITIDENLNIIDLGRTGQSTPDGNYYYKGTVTLFSEDVKSITFDCYEGKIGLERGCRGIILNGQFINLDRNKFVYINGTRYKASGLTE